MEHRSQALTFPVLAIGWGTVSAAIAVAAALLMGVVDTFL
jgi:hypothetical protein